MHGAHSLSRLPWLSDADQHLRLHRPARLRLAFVSRAAAPAACRGARGVGCDESRDGGNELLPELRPICRSSSSTRAINSSILAACAAITAATASGPLRYTRSISSRRTNARFPATSRHPSNQPDDPLNGYGTKLFGAGAVGNAGQGASVALSADGNTALVGGPGDDMSRGAAWVFTRSGSDWSQQAAKLAGTGAVGASEQGASVGLSADGNTALIGGREDNEGTGAAWLFTRSGSAWTQQGTKLVGTGGVGQGGQGSGVALSADGNTILSGGYGDNYGRGAAWVFASTAAFPQHTLAVAKTGAGSGTLTSVPVGIDCGSVCSFDYGSGNVVTLTATPSAGSTFAGWAGAGCSGTSTCTVTMNSDQSVTARFTPNSEFTIANIKTYGNGMITLSVKIPGPGTVDVLETAWNDNLARITALLQPAPYRFVFARHHTAAQRAGTLNLRVRPNARGNLLVHHHTYRVTLRLWVTYRPNAGHSRSIGVYGLHLPAFHDPTTDTDGSER